MTAATAFALLLLAATAAGDAGVAASDRPFTGPLDASVPLRAAAWSDLPTFAQADHRGAFAAFRALCLARGKVAEKMRSAGPNANGLGEPCEEAARTDAAVDPGQALAFFTTHFEPWRIAVDGGRAFLTGYYEPALAGSPVPSADFTAPVLARPDDLVSLDGDRSLYPDEEFGVDAPLSAGRRAPGGSLVPYPSRAVIESGGIAAHTHPLVWLRDPVEVFFVQVQGSARVELPGGTHIRLAYDGRNGLPYTSIGRIVVEEGHIPLAQMSLPRLKGWLRADPDRAKSILRRNRSYVFFKVLADADPAAGPVGAAGTALTPLTSIAIDDRLWAYGLPFWIDAQLPWRTARAEPFRRLMIAEDTGSAIRGPARADIFFGSGEAAGERAGDIRHPGDVFVLLPKRTSTGAPAR